MVNKFVFDLKTIDIVVKLRARHLFKIYRVYVEIIRLGLVKVAVLFLIPIF